MPEVEPIMNGMDAVLIDAARSELAVFDAGRSDVASLATVASLARTIEPELLRSLRLALGDRLPGKRITVATESALWFSSLVEGRGSEGITLLPEVLQVVRPRLAANRQLLEDARVIVEESHRSAPDVLQWEERIVYLSLTGQNSELEKEILRGVYSISKGTRLPLANWIGDMWTRLPPEAQQNPLMIKLRQVASSLTLRRSPRTSGQPAVEGALIIDFSTLPTRELGVMLQDTRFLIGDVPEAEFGILVPDLNPVEFDFSYGSETWESRVLIKNAYAEIDAWKGTVRVRTLAGQIYHLDPAVFRLAETKRRFRVAFSFHEEKRAFVDKVARILAVGFGEAAILYDKFHEAEFARRDLNLYLPELYKESDLVVLVICHAMYDRWMGLDWMAVNDLLKKRRDEEVMLFRFEQAEVTGLYSTAGFIELDDKTPAQTATLIFERLALNEGKPKNYYTSAASSSQPPTTSTPNNLPRLQPFFGRRKELKRIADALAPDSRTWGVLIDGPGGIGKTSLAVRAAYDVPPDHFERIIFLSVKDRELDDDGVREIRSFILPGFLEMLNELARELEQPDITKAPESERLRLILDALSATQALLILDHLESLTKTDRDQLLTFVNRLPRDCKAILTSRLRFGSGGTVLTLDRLEEMVALQILADLAKDNPLLAETSEMERRTLYAEVGGNPLLLRWTAGQLGRGSCRTIADAIAFLRSCPPDNDPLEFVFGDLTNEFTLEETRVLAALTYFTLPTRVGPIAEVADLKERATESALRILTNRSLVVPDNEEQQFTAVRQVGAFVRKRRPEVVHETGERLERRAYVLIVENAYKNYDRFPVIDAAWPLVAAALPLFTAGPNDRLQTVCDALQFFLDYTGRWDESLALARVAESRAADSRDYLKAGWRATDSGWIYAGRRQSDEALACSDRALSYFREANADARAFGWALRLRGKAYQIAKDYPAAIAAYHDALGGWRSVSPESVEITIVLNDLAEVQHLSGNLAAAERGYREALDLARTLHNVEGEAELTGNLALLSLDRKDWQSAEKLAREGLSLAERIGRQELIASNSHRLAISLIGQEKRAKALPFAHRAVAIYSKLGSPQLEAARQTLFEVEPPQM